MARSPIVKRILALFKKTHEKSDDEEPPYPKELTQLYDVSKEILGAGSFAVVKKCNHLATGKSYALKIILKKAVKGCENVIDHELDILKKVRHPHIVSMHDLYESKEGVYIVTDLATGGELIQRLLDKGSYTEKDAANIVRQLLEGLAYLHDHDIVHRDIKPENLLFETMNEDSKLLITDFGLSRILNSHGQLLTTACGTPLYTAPEVLRRKGYGKAVDIWSTGVITYCLLCGYTPFYGDDEPALFQAIDIGQYSYDDDYWRGISDSAKDLIDQMLVVDPSKRITVHEALQHPWIIGEAEYGPGAMTNLVPNVRRGIDSRQSLKTMVMAMVALEHWSHLDHLKHLDSLVNVSDTEPETVETKC